MQADVARLGLVEQRQDHRVDADRLARAGRARDQAMRHLLQVGDDGHADDVLAEADRQLRAGVGVRLRAEHFREADRLPLGVGQLERHRRLAGNRLDDADRDQAERARQVLGEAHDLRALDAERRLDLVARDHRPGRGGDDAHLDAEVLEALLDQARGHLERLGADALDALRRRIEQVDLRQLGVDQLAEERLLALLDDARALRHVDQRRLDDDRQVLLLQLVLDLEHLVALADRLGAEARVLGALDALDPARAQRLDRRAERVGDAQPGEAQRQRGAGDEHGDPEHARAGEAEQVLARAAEDEAEHAAGVAAGDLAFPLVQARPFERRAGGEQQREAEPHRPRRQDVGRRDRRRAAVRAQRSRQGAEPGARADQRPPTRPSSRRGRRRCRRARRRGRRRGCGSGRRCPRSRSPGSAALCVASASSAISQTTAPTRRAACSRQCGAGGRRRSARAPNRRRRREVNPTEKSSANCRRSRRPQESGPTGPGPSRPAGGKRSREGAILLRSSLTGFSPSTAP